MSYSALRWGFLEPVYTPSERLVLLVLCNAHVLGRAISMTIKQLTIKTGLHPDTIRKALKGLEEKALIQRHQEPGFPTLFVLVAFDECNFSPRALTSENVPTGIKWS